MLYHSFNILIFAVIWIWMLIHLVHYSTELSMSFLLTSLVWFFLLFFQKTRKPTATAHLQQELNLQLCQKTFLLLFVLPPTPLTTSSPHLWTSSLNTAHNTWNSSSTGTGIFCHSRTFKGIPLKSLLRGSWWQIWFLMGLSIHHPFSWTTLITWQILTVSLLCWLKVFFLSFPFTVWRVLLDCGFFLHFSRAEPVAQFLDMLTTRWIS